MPTGKTCPLFAIGIDPRDISTMWPIRTLWISIPSHPRLVASLTLRRLAARTKS
jgi:hypothetical protein